LLCRWVAIVFCRRLSLLDQHRATFETGPVCFTNTCTGAPSGSTPMATAVRRFGAAALAVFRAAGGDSDVTRLPSLLAARVPPLMPCGPFRFLGKPGDAGIRGELAGDLVESMAAA